MSGLSTYIKKLSTYIASIREKMCDPGDYWQGRSMTSNFSEVIYESYWDDNGRDPLTLKDWALFTAALAMILITFLK